MMYVSNTGRSKVSVYLLRPCQAFSCGEFTSPVYTYSQAYESKFYTLNTTRNYATDPRKKTDKDFNDEFLCRLRITGIIEEGSP